MRGAQPTPPPPTEGYAFASPPLSSPEKRFSPRRQPIPNPKTQRKPKILQLANIQFEGQGFAAEAGGSSGSPHFRILSNNLQRFRRPRPIRASLIQTLQPHSNVLH